MKAKFWILIKRHYAIIAYLVFYCLAFSIKLIASPAPFFDWDESIYAQVAKEMTDKFSLVPLWQDNVWLDKPPLVPLFYGVVFRLTPFVLPEISGRLATLLLSGIALYLIYLLYYRLIKETCLTTLVIVLTSLLPIFLQRSQVLNIDVFLLIGWIGYILFHRRFKLSLLFLIIGVLSKSLVGFYPAIIIAFYYFYLYLTKSKTKLKYHTDGATSEFKLAIGHVTLQVALTGLWYAIMLAVFGKAFLTQHIYETHLKRVSSSIESHFGQRTYYIDLLFEQFIGSPLFSNPIHILAVLSALGMFLGLALLLHKYYKTKKTDQHGLLNATFIIPWFAFLNLAKTKIFWYAYPYIPQFAFLLLYPLVLLKHRRVVYYGAIIGITLFIGHYFFIHEKVLEATYSRREPHQIIASAAKKQCKDLTVIVSKDTRTAFATLEKMNLLITTSTWWGEHPSMVYYFDKYINFVYKLDNFATLIQESDCVVLDEDDLALHNQLKQLKILNQQKELYLLKNN